MAQSGGNTPILTAADLGATRIIALPTGFACALHEPPMGAIARALHAITLLIAHQMVRDLRECIGKVDVFTVPNLCPLDASPYDFSHADQLIEQAAERTRHWIEGGGLSRPEDSDVFVAALALKFLLDACRYRITTVQKSGRLSRFLTKHPTLEMEVVLDDGNIVVVEEGIGVARRFYSGTRSCVRYFRRRPAREK